MAPSNQAHDAMAAAESVPPDVISAHGGRLARRLFSNYLFQTMNWGVRLVEQLLLVPLYIFAWGTVFYKDWLVLFAIVAFLYWCTFGTDEYFGNLFLRYVSTGDRAALRRQVRLGLFVAILVTLLLFVPLYGILMTVDLPRVLGFSVIGERTALFCLVAMTVPMFAWYVIAILHAIYRAYGDFSRGECIFAIYNVSQISAVALALAFRQPPQVVALIYGALPLAYALAVFVDVRRRYPEIGVGLAVPTRDEWRRIVPQSLLYFSTPLSLAITQNATLLLFGFLGLGPLATVKFNVLRIFTGLTRQVGSQSFAVGSGIEMARQHVRRDHDSCRRLYADTGRIVSCLVGVLAGISIPMSAPFVRLWTHGEVGADLSLVLCFLVGIFIAAPGRASLMLLRYTNHARAIAWASCVYSIGGLLLAWPLAAAFDGFGVALAFAITETLAIGLFPPLVVSRLFGFGAARHLLFSYASGGVAFGLSFAVGSLLFHQDGIGFVELGTRLAIWGVVMLPLGSALILTRDQRARILALARRRVTSADGMRAG